MFKKIRENLNINLESILTYIIRVTITIVVGYILVIIVNKIISKFLKRTKLDKTIIMFFISIIKPIVYLIYFLSVLTSMGVSLTGATAIITASGVAISLALQSSLSNIANGIMIIFSKPFKVGDYISIEEIDGTVTNISMVLTTLVTPDNKQITMPNNNVFQANITNFTAMNIRRLDMEFYVSHNDNVILVKEVLYKSVMSHTLVMKERVPMIHLKEYRESSLLFICRAWVRTDDYWDLRWDITEIIHKGLLDNGISIPYNKIDVRIIDKLM